MTAVTPDSAKTITRTEPVRLGVVSFVNALPLIDGLEKLLDVELRHSVPSLLLEQLESGSVDVALCSSIDYQRSDQPLVILPVGLLGCDGPTLTVRLYSTKPIAKLQRIYCDTDSHTSVALLQILLREVHKIDPELIDYDAREHVAKNKPIDWPEAMMLIGDKVVTDSAPAVRYPFQLDLGAGWVELTGLPFVFAVWMARCDAAPAMIDLASAVLDRQRRHNLERIDWIIHHRAKSRNWPGDLASEYLKQHISYEFTNRRLEGLKLFFEKAHRHGLVENLKPIELAS